jgi:hypothetical protein
MRDGNSWISRAEEYCRTECVPEGGCRPVRANRRVGARRHSIRDRLRVRIARLPQVTDLKSRRARDPILTPPIWPPATAICGGSATTTCCRRRSNSRPARLRGAAMAARMASSFPPLIWSSSLAPLDFRMAVPMFANSAGCCGSFWAPAPLTRLISPSTTPAQGHLSGPNPPTRTLPCTICLSAASESVPLSDRSTKAVLEVMARGQRRFVHDSPLEGGVYCELVSEVGLRRLANKARFQGVYG